jgi:hypothetical protein
MDSREVERLLGAFASLVADGDCVPTTDVQDVTGMPARDVRDYVKSVAARGIWSAVQDQKQTIQSVVTTERRISTPSRETSDDQRI